MQALQAALQNHQYGAALKLGPPPPPHLEHSLKLVCEEVRAFRDVAQHLLCLILHLCHHQAN